MGDAPTRCLCAPCTRPEDIQDEPAEAHNSKPNSNIGKPGKKSFTYSSLKTRQSTACDSVFYKYKTEKYFSGFFFHIHFFKLRFQQ